MYILGYSGIHNAASLKRQYLPNLAEREYKIHQGADSAAALFFDGHVIAAAAEERFNGPTHHGQFPKEAINYCLQEANINLNQVDAICHGFDYQPFQSFYEGDPYSTQCFQTLYSPQAQIKLFSEHFNFKLTDEMFYPIRHHDAHAASAYFMSGLDHSLILVADGMGELDTISVYYASGQDIKVLNRDGVLSSLGILYSIFTMYLGFVPNNDEYKVMGLASYGDATRFQHFVEHCIQLLPEGRIYIPLLEKNKNFLDQQTYAAARHWLAQSLIPEREPSAPIEQIHKDIAASLQSTLEKALMHIITYWQDSLNVKNLCMAGGVALNCTANGKLLKNYGYRNLFIQPAASDDGTALGAALYHYYVSQKKPYQPKAKRELPFYGPAYRPQEVQQTLQHFEQQVEFQAYELETLIELAANALQQAKVIAWMQGRMEFGPRALGNRSILAAPHINGMGDKINRIIKKRESFRPFAPSVLAEEAHRFFDIPKHVELPYMLFTVDVKLDYRDKLPAITHVDGSARLQTVSKSEHYLYWKLIKKFGELSEFPVLLNTSFNVKDRPIVRTPKDAMETFLGTNIDVLFIENFMVTKR